MNIYEQILEKKKKGLKMFAVLIDPDKQNIEELKALISFTKKNHVDFIFVGGSLLTSDSLDYCLNTIKSNCSIPTVLFPGNTMQIHSSADGILFLSLISGRNPEMLIGQQVISAPMLKSSNLEVISTGYMLIESGQPTTVSYMSNTTPIPHNKTDIAACTAMAGDMLGLKLIFMDGGSGAKKPISSSMIRAVSNNIDVPLIIGGGICDGKKALENCEAGADLIVVGNSIEKNPEKIHEIAQAIQNYNIEHRHEVLN